MGFKYQPVNDDTEGMYPRCDLQITKIHIRLNNYILIKKTEFFMFADRVYETSTTSGTGNMTMSGAVTGYRTFSAAFGAAAAYYVIVNRANPAEWEVGSFTVSGATLARIAGNVLSGSSGAGVLVNFSAGIKDIYNSPPASQMQVWATSAPVGKVDRAGDTMTGALRGVGTTAATTGFQINNGTDLGSLFATSGHSHAANTVPNNHIWWTGTSVGDGSSAANNIGLTWSGSGWSAHKNTACACACDCCG